MIKIINKRYRNQEYTITPNENVINIPSNTINTQTIVTKEEKTEPTLVENPMVFIKVQNDIEVVNETKEVKKQRTKKINNTTENSAQNG